MLQQSFENEKFIWTEKLVADVLD